MIIWWMSIWPDIYVTQRDRKLASTETVMNKTRLRLKLQQFTNIIIDILYLSL